MYSKLWTIGSSNTCFLLILVDIDIPIKLGYWPVLYLNVDLFKKKYFLACITFKV